MPDLFEKPYAHLVGEVDGILSYMIRDMMLPHAYDWDHVRVVMERLRSALEGAEDVYLEQSEK